MILEIIDNGVGFDATIPSSGLGLRGIQERVQIIAGKLQIETTPGTGTCLGVEIPLKISEINSEI